MTADAAWESEFLRLLAANYRHIYACALTVVGHPDDANDVVQEVCVLLWEKCREGEFDQILNFRKWACGITFNLARAHQRKLRRQTGAGLSEEILAQVIQARTSGNELFELRRDVLRECLGKMPRVDRDFLSECYQQGASMTDVAQQTGKTLSAVYSKVKRLRQILSDCMTKRLAHGEDW